MFNNKIRKFLGMPPKDTTVTAKDGTVTATSYYPDFTPKDISRYEIRNEEKIKQGEQISFAPNGKLISTSSFENNQMKEKTEYRADGVIISTSYFSDGTPEKIDAYREKDGKRYKDGPQAQYYPDGKPLSLAFYEGGQLQEMMEYHTDGSKTESRFSGKYSRKTHFNADGGIDYRNLLFNESGKPATTVISSYASRKRAYIVAFVNGHELGEAIGTGHAYRESQELESLRQNALYNAAERAIKNNDIEGLEKITSMVLAQKELLDNPEFEACLEKAYKNTTEQAPKDNLEAFQTTFLQNLEQSGYHDIKPQSRSAEALNRVRNNVKTTNKAQEEQKTETKENSAAENQVDKVSLNKSSGLEI